MRRMVFLMVALVLALPLAAFANSVDIQNSSGILTASTSGLGVGTTLSLSGSTLTNFGGVVGTNLGSLTFTTGAFTPATSGGTLTDAGTFASGGTFVITGNGSSGVPNAVIFTGTFTGTAQWVVSVAINGDHIYTLTGPISGTWFNGRTVFGATAQLTMDAGKGFFSGLGLASGDTIVNTTVPEPGTLGLLGTGLLGIGGVLRRKLKST
jgi:hypothetical protein